MYLLGKFGENSGLDEVRWGLALEDVEDALNGDVTHLAAGPDRGAADVGQQNRVGGGEKSWVDRRFPVKDVEACPPEATSFESVGHRHFVEDRTACGIDHYGCGLHPLDLPEADETSCRWRERDMDAHDVRAFEQLVE